jgi:glycosyltransferase involved in cell wall biosynthesis
MKIRLLHHSVPPVVGGVESVIRHHARLMQAAGHSVRLIAARGRAVSASIPITRIALADSIHPRILAAKSELDAGRIPETFEPLVQELAAHLRRAVRGTDLLIAHNVCSLNKNLILTEALHRLYREPGFPRLILWHHDLAWTAPRYRRELHDGFPWDLLRMDWPGATHVVISELRRRELADLLQIPAGRIHVIPNGIHTLDFLSISTRTRELVRRTGLMDSEPILLLPVRITRRKNLEFALRTLACLRRFLPDAILVVTGPLGAHNPVNQKYFDSLLQLREELGLERSAHFLAELHEGLLPDSVIADLYRLSDALFLPSLEEGFGIPLIEAAVSRRPVFCSNLDSLRELGADDVHYFDPEDDPERAATLIATRLEADPTSRFAGRARRAYEWTQIYNRHIEPLIQSLAASPAEERSP